MKKTIWFDITNVPHVNFLLPVIHKYEEEFEMVFTIRDFAETKNLFEKLEKLSVRFRINIFINVDYEKCSKLTEYINDYAII